MKRTRTCIAAALAVALAAVSATAAAQKVEWKFST
jgi:hypothetical protein